MLCLWTLAEWCTVREVISWPSQLGADHFMNSWGPQLRLWMLVDAGCIVGTMQCTGGIMDSSGGYAGWTVDTALHCVSGTDTKGNAG